LLAPVTCGDTMPDAEKKKYVEAVKKLEAVSKKRELVESKIVDENKKLAKGGGREDIQKTVKVLEKLQGDHDKLCKEYETRRGWRWARR